MRPLLSRLFRWLALPAAIVAAAPASAQAGAVVGTPVDVCIARAAPGDTPAALLADPGRFDCRTPQSRFGPGDYWVVSAPLPAAAVADHVRIASVWQDAATLYAFYPDGHWRGWRYDPLAASRHLQLGAMIDWSLPRDAGPPRRLLWRIDGSANLRGVVIAPRLASAEQAAGADLEMAAIYAGFGGLCLALLIYNLAMWGALRHRFQLAYCAMVAMLMLYAFSSSGTLAWVWPGIGNNHRLLLNYALLAGVAVSAIVFARAFFPPSVFAGWVSGLANGVIVAIVGATVVLIVTAPWQMRAVETAYSLAFGGALLLAAPILARAWRERNRQLWLFALAWAAPIAFALMRLLGNLAVVRWSFWLDNSTILAMTFEAVASTLAIAYRIRRLAVERDEAIEREVIAARLADTDPLTGLLNRRALLRQALERGGEQALVLADLDHFKRVNETLGHDGGDEVLRLFARVLRQASPAGALIARMGGEEFAILAPAGQPIPPDAILARLRAARMPFDIAVTASIGAGAGPLASEAEWRALYRRADRALFDAKQAGRDRARFAAAA